MSYSTHLYFGNISNRVLMSGFQANGMECVGADPQKVTEPERNAGFHTSDSAEHFLCARCFLSVKATPINKSMCSDGKICDTRTHVVWQVEIVALRKTKAS